jgi:hypothetical protein
VLCFAIRGRVEAEFIKDDEGRERGVRRRIEQMVYTRSLLDPGGQCTYRRAQLGGYGESFCAAPGDPKSIR